MTPSVRPSRGAPAAAAFVALLCGAASPAQAPKAAEAFERAAPKEHGLSALDAVFPDLARALDVRDPAAGAAYEARLREIERELKLWETVRLYAKQGRIVELADLRPSRLKDGAADVATERAAAEAAKRAFEERTARMDAARRAAPRADAPAKAPAGHGSALLDVVVEAPPLNAVRAPAARPTSRPSADPAALSKALYEAGDAQGAVDALAQLPEASLTPELLYRRARAYDRLRRTAEARAAYAATAKADPEGFYGRQARWMLDVANRLETVRVASEPSAKGDAK